MIKRDEQEGSSPCMILKCLLFRVVDSHPRFRYKMTTVRIILLLMNVWLLTYGDDCARHPGWCRFARLHGNVNGAQSEYLAQLNEAEPSSERSQKTDPGSLVYVTAISKVSVNLDEFSTDPAMLARIVASLTAKDSQFWIDRATQQIWLTQYRFFFRPAFIADKYQLPLTQPNHWNFVIQGNATRDQSIDGHDSVYVNYTWSTFVLSDYNSPSISEPNLGKIGGKWVESFILPSDPYNIIQRTGYACMDESEYLIFLLS